MSLDATVSANASAGDIFGGSDSDMQSAMASSFAELPISAQADASVSIASASAFAMISGSLTSDTATFFGDSTAQNFGPSSDEDGGSLAFANSRIELEFLAPAGAEYMLDYALNASSSFGTLGVSLRFIGPSGVILAFDASSGDLEEGIEFGMLDAGIHRLVIESGPGTDTFGSQDYSESFFVSLFVIPSPGAAGLLTFAALLTGARRRRSSC